MPIKIGKSLIAKLPEQERENPQKMLLNKSGGFCFLCGGELNEASDTIFPDHDIPEASGGGTSISNLNLVHAECNAFKRDHKTVDVRPYLKLLHQIKKMGGFLSYDQAATLMGITPLAISITDNGDAVSITYPNKNEASFPVFSEKNKEGEFRFCFAEMPRNTIFNDEKCQPRSIKPQHLWQIYNDINRNPLHEAPACRLESAGGAGGLYRALMFDGQHKTLSFWIDGRNSIVTKIYLDLTKDAAVRLVNSIQAKIKKLPLSPFELSAKMSEEWKERVSKYEDEVGTEDASEEGFIKWVEKDERSRAKAAFEDALLQNVLDDEGLRFTSLISIGGDASLKKYKIKEAAFKNKVLKSLLHMSPLSEVFIESQKLRDREVDSIVRLLNILYEHTFKPSDGEHLSPQEEIRAERIIYQASLSYVSKLLRSVVGNRLYAPDGREFIEKEISSEQWALIEEDVRRLLSHPVWTAKLDASHKMRSIADALSKNQDVAKSFEAVGLKPGFVAGMDKLSPSCLE